MAEYKNGVNFMGITSVDTEDVTIDIPTGRAVFADPDKYQNDPKYKARVDKYVREGFHLVNEGSGGSGGMDYDIVICKVSSGIELIKGNFNDVYNKLHNREPILGMFINSSDYYSSVTTDLYPLTYITDVHEDEIIMGFTRVSHNSNTSIYMSQWNVTWDAPDTISTEFKTATINSAP